MCLYINSSYQKHLNRVYFIHSYVFSSPSTSLLHMHFALPSYSSYPLLLYSVIFPLPFYPYLLPFSYPSSPWHSHFTLVLLLFPSSIQLPHFPPPPPSFPASFWYLISNIFFHYCPLFSFPLRSTSAFNYVILQLFPCILAYSTLTYNVHKLCEMATI